MSFLIPESRRRARRFFRRAAGFAAFACAVAAAFQVAPYIGDVDRMARIGEPSESNAGFSLVAMAVFVLVCGAAATVGYFLVRIVGWWVQMQISETSGARGDLSSNRYSEPAEDEDDGLARIVERTVSVAAVTSTGPGIKPNGAMADPYGSGEPSRNGMPARRPGTLPAEPSVADTPANDSVKLDSQSVQGERSAADSEPATREGQAASGSESTTTVTEPADPEQGRVSAPTGGAQANRKRASRRKTGSGAHPIPSDSPPGANDSSASTNRGGRLRRRRRASDTGS